MQLDFQNDQKKKKIVKCPTDRRSAVDFIIGLFNDVYVTFFPIFFIKADNSIEYQQHMLLLRSR